MKDQDILTNSECDRQIDGHKDRRTALT